MNQQQENGMAVLSFFIWSIVIAIIVMTCSCTTRKTVTETIFVHDTIHVTHTDTVSEVKVMQHNDTVIQREVHTITLDAGGDTIREIHHYHDINRTVIVDSTARYQSLRDSLSRALRAEKEKLTQVRDNHELLTQKIFFITLIIIIIIAGKFISQKQKS